MAGTLGVEAEKRIKALRKKLTQIDKLKQKKEPYTPEEVAKVNGEAQILAQIDALEKGGDVEEVAMAVQVAEEKADPNPPAAPSPDVPEPENVEAPPKELDLNPAEAEKRVRALKKKLGQVQKLKERGGTFTAEELEKVNAEPALYAECTDLEINLLDPEAKKNARAAQKKLKEISKLRAKGGGLTPQEKDKLSKESGLKKELQDVLNARVPFKDPTVPKPQETTPAAKTVPAPKSVAAQQKMPAVAPVSPVRAAVAPPAEAAAAAQKIMALSEDDPDVKAFTHAFAQEENLEEEGFLESRASKSKAKRAKAAARKEEEAAQQVTSGAPEAPAENVERVEESWEAPAPAAEAIPEQVNKWQAPEQSVTPAPVPAEPVQMPAAAPAVAPVVPAAAPAVVPVAPAAAPAVVPAAAPAGQSNETKDATEKRLRALKKKVGQINKLKAKGEDAEYTVEEKEKLESEKVVLAEISALENGEPWPPVVQAVEEPAAEVQAVEEPAAPPAAAPQLQVENLDPAEAEKRLKALKKKITQITKLKEKGGPFSPEEAAKIASEPQILEDIERLKAYTA